MARRCATGIMSNRLVTTIPSPEPECSNSGHLGSTSRFALRDNKLSTSWKSTVSAQSHSHIFSSHGHALRSVQSFDDLNRFGIRRKKHLQGKLRQSYIGRRSKDGRCVQEGNDACFRRDLQRRRVPVRPVLLLRDKAVRRRWVGH